MVSRPRNGLSLCAGAGGLDMGLMLAEPGFHTRCFVEWDEYPRQAIIAAQRAGYFAQAPIWDDITTFDGNRLRGAIDTVLAGYPCQPFSSAGQRRGADDPRHLWPHVARIIREVDPEWIYLENVSGHISLGLETVLREIWDMGFTPATGLFAAGETGAPHERQRVFIVAHRQHDPGRGKQQSRTAQRRRSRPAGEGSRLADADGRNPSPERQQPSGKQRFFPDRRGDGDGPMENAGRAEQRPGDAERRDHDRDDAGRIETAGRVREPSETLDDTQRERRQAGWNGDNAGDVGHQPDTARQRLADTGGAGLQERQRAGSPDQRHGQAAHGSASERGGAWVFPPRPADTDAWAYVIAANPACAPAFSRSDIARTVHRVAALYSPDAAGAAERASIGLPISDVLSTLEGQAGQMVDDPALVASLRQLAYGLADRTRALRLLGNGVYPLAAGYAFRSLSSALGLCPVDMETPGAPHSTATNEHV